MDTLEESKMSFEMNWTYKNAIFGVHFRFVEVADDESKEVCRHLGSGPIRGDHPSCVAARPLAFIDAVGEGDHVAAVLDLRVEDGPEVGLVEARQGAASVGWLHLAGGEPSGMGIDGAEEDRGRERGEGGYELQKDGVREDGGRGRERERDGEKEWSIILV